MKTKKSQPKLASVLLLLTLALQSCASKSVKIASEENAASVSANSIYNVFPLVGYNNYTPVNQYSLMPRYQNFQNKQYPKQSFLVANMIAVVQPEMNEAKRDEMAAMIAKVSKKFNIKPEIMVSIIDTESNFQTNMVSSTGDLSIAQINVDVWNKEFARLNLPVIDKERVVQDLEYSLTFMAEILSVLKMRYAETDPCWYARYHSSTPKYKNDYFQKLSFRLELIARSENLRNQIAQIQNIELLAPKTSDKALASLEANNYLQSILTPEPMSSPELFSPVQSDSGKVLEYAKNFVFDVIRL